MAGDIVIGVDLGGTNVTIGKVVNDRVVSNSTFPITSNGPEEQIVSEITNAIDTIFEDSIAGIGVGVPSLVDVEKGIVYNVQNIPSWKEVHLREILENRYNKPVYVNNDANCFAVGEKYFGKGKPFEHMVGITIGTGLGAGVIINNHLYSGMNCGAGEFGSIHYNSHICEHYCSGQFFINHHSMEGHQVFQKAQEGDKKALEIFEEFGHHLGNVITTILYTLDPQAIFIGGSVSNSWIYFKDAMWETVKKFPYKHAIDKLVIEKSEHPQIPILGAAALYFDAKS